MENSQENKGEIILYNVSEKISLEVRLEQETVWLSLMQMVDLFASTKQNISLHINNIYKGNELNQLSTVKEYLTVQKEGNRCVQRKVKYYNLDVIISVGYRVKSLRGTHFRQWANQIIKDYMLRGFVINQKIADLENKVEAYHTQYSNEISDIKTQVDFFVQHSLPPIQGVFYNGQIFDAYKFANDLIRSANTRIILIDNYVDDTVLTMLDKRKKNVVATIYTKTITEKLQLDLQKHNAQYASIDIQPFANSHDRFLIIDDDVYLVGASLKDLGKKMFAFSKLEMNAEEFLLKFENS